MAKMADLIFNIPNIVPQPSPIFSIASASGLYDKFYGPIESYDPLSDVATVEPTLTDMSYACDYLMDCFQFDRKELLRDYMYDLFMYRLMFVCGVEIVTGSTGTVTTNKYQDILDETKARWTDYTFAAINAYMTFAIIEAM